MKELIDIDPVFFTDTRSFLEIGVRENYLSVLTMILEFSPAARFVREKVKS